MDAVIECVFDVLRPLLQDRSAAVCDPQVETGDDGDAVRASLMMHPREMDGAEHVSVRLCVPLQLKDDAQQFNRCRIYSETNNFISSQIIAKKLQNCFFTVYKCVYACWSVCESAAV